MYLRPILCSIRISKINIICKIYILCIKTDVGGSLSFDILSQIFQVRGFFNHVDWPCTSIKQDTLLHLSLKNPVNIILGAKSNIDETRRQIYWIFTHKSLMRINILYCCSLMQSRLHSLIFVLPDRNCDTYIFNTIIFSYNAA